MYDGEPTVLVDFFSVCMENVLRTASSVTFAFKRFQRLRRPNIFFSSWRVFLASCGKDILFEDEWYAFGRQLAREQRNSWMTYFNKNNKLFSNEINKLRTLFTKYGKKKSGNIMPYCHVNDKPYRGVHPIVVVVVGIYYISARQLRQLFTIQIDKLIWNANLQAARCRSMTNWRRQCFKMTMKSVHIEIVHMQTMNSINRSPDVVHRFAVIHHPGCIDLWR